MAVGTLEEEMQAQLGSTGFLVQGGRDLFMEVMDASDGRVWMSAAPVTVQEFEKFQLQEGLSKVGCARASMDSALFLSSPGQSGDKVLERMIDGRRFINVARPLQQVASSQPGGPVEISVDKAHVLGFAAQRTVSILQLPEGNFVEAVGEDAEDNSLVLPEGASLLQVELGKPWVVTLPSPTRTFFWFSGGLRSFQGPVTLPD